MLTVHRQETEVETDVESTHSFKVALGGFCPAGLRLSSVHSRSFLRGTSARCNGILDPHARASLSPCLGHHPLHIRSRRRQPCARLLRRHARYRTQYCRTHAAYLCTRPLALATWPHVHKATAHTRALSASTFAVCGPLWVVCIARIACVDAPSPSCADTLSTR